MPFGNWWRFGAFIAVLVAMNLAIVSRLANPGPELDLPYYPTFQEQLAAGNVKEVSSKGAAVLGELKTEVTYPAKGATGSRTGKTFRMEIPSYVDGSRLEDRLQAAGVIQNARNPFAQPSLVKHREFSAIRRVAMTVFPRCYG